MEVVCLVATLLLFGAQFYVLTLLRQNNILYKLLASTVLTCAQIIMTELILGLFGLLYLPIIIVVNFFCAAIAITLCSRFKTHEGMAMLRADLTRAKEAAWSAFDVSALILGLIACLTYTWILTASYFLPARGIDDLAYHLPAIFEYARSHEIRLLPLAIPQFAYPQNAELLFLWPVLFTHNQRMVDAANVPFVLLSVLTVYALARHFSFPERNSLFTAVLYALCPVVLMQAGVNYVDVIVSLFLLLSLYFSLRSYERGQPMDIYLAGLSIGLMCGMKYTAPFLALPLLLLLFPPLLRNKSYHIAGFLAIMALAGGWWYARNAYLFGSPLFPMQLHAPVADGYVNSKGGSILQNIRYNLPYWITRYPLQDSGIGTHNGGFGLVFWGLCFSSWFVAAFRGFISCGRQNLPKLVVLSYLPAGFLLLLSFPSKVIDFNGRLVLFVVAVGLLALNEVLSMIADKTYTAIIKGICIGLSVITVSLFSVSVNPTYGLGAVFSDKRKGELSPEFRYATFYANNRSSWELLDLLTRREGGGLNCAMAGNGEVFWPSPVYGSRLQNRVLNMEHSNQGPVDAYVFSFSLTSLLRQLPAEPWASASPNGRPTILAILAKESYVPIVHSEHACLLIRKELFELPENQIILRDFYRKSWPAEIDLAERLETTLEPNIPIITADALGYGVRSADMIRGRKNRVYLAYDGGEAEMAKMKNIELCYTFQKPASGCRSRMVLRTVHSGKELTVFLNRRS